MENAPHHSYATAEGLYQEFEGKVRQLEETEGTLAADVAREFLGKFKAFLERELFEEAKDQHELATPHAAQTIVFANARVQTTRQEMQKVLKHAVRMAEIRRQMRQLQWTPEN